MRLFNKNTAQGRDIILSMANVDNANRFNETINQAVHGMYERGVRPEDIDPTVWNPIYSGALNVLAGSGELSAEDVSQLDPQVTVFKRSS